MGTKLFKTKPDAEKRTIRYQIRLTTGEDATIRHLAAIRQLTVADFYRRAALGRRADVRMEADIILELSALTRAIRRLHADLASRGIELSAEGFRPVIKEAGAAILRIAK